MPAPSYAFENYVPAASESAYDIVTRIETRLSEAGWLFIEQVTFTQASTSRLMRVWQNPASLNGNGADFYIGLVRNTAANNSYVSIRTFEAWNTTTKGLTRPVSAAPATQYPAAAPSQIIFANGQFLATTNMYTGTYTSNVCYTSPDGITWTSRRMPVNGYWGGIAYGNGTLVALSGFSWYQNASVAASSAIAASSIDDGVTWTQRTLPATVQWAAVVYGSGPGLWVAVGNATSIAASSPDGITWTQRAMPSSGAWTSVAYGNGTYVSVSRASGTVAATSTNGTTWTTRTLSATATWTAVTYGNGLFVAVSLEGTISSSPDGITWTTRATGQNSLYNVTYGNGMFLATANNTSGQQVTYSLDGITWVKSISIIGGSYPIANAYGNGTWVQANSNIVVENSFTTYTDPTISTTIPFTYRAASWSSPSAPGEQSLINGDATTIVVNTTSYFAHGYTDNSFTATTCDIAILASKSYLAVGVSPNNSGNYTFTCIAGAYQPAYADATTSVPALCMVSGTGGAAGLVSLSRNVRSIPDSLGYHSKGQIAPDGIPLGSYAGALKEPVSQTLKAVRAAIVSGPGSGFTTSGGMRGWLYDALLLPLTTSTGVRPGDTITVAGKTYAHFGNTYPNVYMAGQYFGIFINTSGGS